MFIDQLIDISGLCFNVNSAINVESADSVQVLHVIGVNWSHFQNTITNHMGTIYTSNVWSVSLSTLNL